MKLDSKIEASELSGKTVLCVYVMTAWLYYKTVWQDCLTFMTWLYDMTILLYDMTV